MSIPLNQLYHYIENIAEETFGSDVVIYRFYPDGSKNIKDMSQLRTFNDYMLQLCPELYCNDQEPLNHAFYQDTPCPTRYSSAVEKIFKQHNIDMPHFNFRGAIRGIWDYALLLHSEQRSKQVELYQKDTYIPVYYWNHAIIARDWFRYAEHINQVKKVEKTFLIYNRAWAGTREYRLRFAELLIQLNLQDLCKTTVNPIEPELGIHYEMHQFENPVWRPQTVLEKYFPVNTAPSYYSANFDIKDYNNTDIEVVLETLFDDDRLHLTEKSLRPIACAQPFILAGTHGSLEYLRNYGFKTFGHIWDESYDLVEDPAERLIQIAELMKQITTWLPHQRKRNLAEAQAIADYNKKHFFSKEFNNIVESELKTNFAMAVDQLKTQNKAQHHMYSVELGKQLPELQALRLQRVTREEQQLLFAEAQKYQK
jgi:predicted XRE-type DNA-binding protein